MSAPTRQTGRTTNRGGSAAAPVPVSPARSAAAQNDVTSQCTAALQFGNTGNFQNGDGGAAVDPCLIPPREETAAARPDSDQDGLYDDDELDVYGTDPWTWDTDGDGSGDGANVYYGSGPLDPFCDPYGCG